MEKKDIMRVDEAADLLGKHPDTVRSLLRKGELPGRKIGREWIMLKSELEKFLKESEQ